MILLDTNVLSELMRPAPNKRVIKWLDERLATNLFICAVTKAEIELGICALPDGERKNKLAVAANEMFSDFSGRCLPYDEVAATRYADLVARRIKKGRPISVEDAQIAAIAIGNGLTLATRNVKDFEEIPELKVTNPWWSEG